MVKCVEVVNVLLSQCLKSLRLKMIFYVFFVKHDFENEIRVENEELMRYAFTMSWRRILRWLVPGNS